MKAGWRSLQLQVPFRFCCLPLWLSAAKDRLLRAFSKFRTQSGTPR